MTNTSIIEGYIEDKRQEFIAQNAQRVFDTIISQAAKFAPSKRYELGFNDPWLWNYSNTDPMRKLIVDRVQLMFSDRGYTCTLEKDEGVSSFSAVVEQREGGSAVQNEVCKLHWSLKPGNFVNKRTGESIDVSRFGGTGPLFTGTVREWYETLIETIIDCSNQIKTKTGRKAEELYVGPNVLCIIESSILYKPFYYSPTYEQDSIKKGTLSNRYNVFLDKEATNVLTLKAYGDTEVYGGLVEVIDLPRFDTPVQEEGK